MEIRSKTKLLLAVLVLELSFATAASAQATKLDLDPAATQIHFTVGSTLHTVHGAFKLKRGTVGFDSRTGKMSGSVVVDVTSGQSGNGGRDRKMHKRVLETERYPEATFTPSQMTGKLNAAGASDVQVRGVLNLHGADHAMTLAFRVEQAGGRLKASSHFVIPYVEWGMKSPSTFILKVSDKVEVEIDAVGRLVTSH